MNHEQMIEDATSDLDNTEGWAADAGRPETARKLAQVAYRAFHPTITTTEELDALPFQSIIKANQFPYMKGKSGGWHQMGIGVTVQSRTLASLLGEGGGFTVLHYGDTP